VPRVGSLLVALPAAAVLLIAGCASQTASTPTRQSAPPTPAAAPAGYACSTANVFTQAVGTAARQQVTLGDTTAILTGTSASDGVEPSQLLGGLLTITRSGRPTVSLPITPPATSPIVDLFIIYTQTEHASTDDEPAGSLCLARFGDGDVPVALIALTTGGAHCCITVRAVPADGGPTADRDFGNYGPWFRDVTSGVGLVPVLVSADNAFAYQFTSFAGSGPPVQLISWTGTAFADVTRRHLDVVRDDAQAFMSAYNDPAQPEKIGFLTGWVADECVVGEAASAWSFVDQQGQLGLLADPVDPADATGATGAPGYEPLLAQFVVSHGYCPPGFGATGSQTGSPAK
jgi:hypothetical protein